MVPRPIRFGMLRSLTCQACPSTRFTATGNGDLTFSWSDQPATHSNPCYAALGVYGQNSDGYEVFAMLPGGHNAIYRSTANYRPWHYYIAPVVYESPPPPIP